MKKITVLFSQYRGLSRSAYILFLGKMITHMGAFIWPLMTLILTQKIGLTALQSAYATTGISIFYLVGGIVGGKIADHFDRKKIIIVFDLISTVFFIACAFVKPSLLMIVLFGIAGLFASMEAPAYDALTADATKSAEREKVYSLGYLGHNLGYMFGAAIGGLLFNHYLHLAFIFDALTTLSSTILIVLFVHPIKKEDLQAHEINQYEDELEKHRSTASLLKERPPLFYMFFAIVLSAFVYNQWGFSLPLYMSYLFGEKGASYYGFLSSFNAFIVISCTPLITWLLRRTFGIPKALLGVALYSVSFLLIIPMPPYPVFYLMIFLFTIGEIANTLGISPYISRRVPSSHRGRLSAIVSIGYGAGSVLGQLVIGSVIDYFSYAAAFGITVGVGVLAVILLFYIHRLDRKYFPKLYETSPSGE